MQWSTCAYLLKCRTVEMIEFSDLYKACLYLCAYAYIALSYLTLAEHTFGSWIPLCHTHRQGIKSRPKDPYHTQYIPVPCYPVPYRIAQYGIDAMPGPILPYHTTVPYPKLQFQQLRNFASPLIDCLRQHICPAFCYLSNMFFVSHRFHSIFLKNHVNIFLHSTHSIHFFKFFEFFTFLTFLSFFTFYT